ncbi:MAG: carbon-nitrogen family hydrolase [Chloroflexota bacterium]
MKLTISLGQIDIKLGDPKTNFAKVKEMSEEAARRGSDIVIFPELWSTGYDLENAVKHATPTDEGIFAETAVLAKENNISILGSCLSLKGEGAFGNTAILHDKQGTAVAEYSKVHLFRLMDEDQYLASGDQLTLVETEWGMGGLGICYDLRFPEMFRRYALSGARMVMLPAEWPHPRLKHWQTLLKARAIENQMFIIACNRVGETKGTSFFGHSCIIDPWGETVIEAGETEVLLTATIDTAVVDEVRQRIPVFEDRREDLY